KQTPINGHSLKIEANIQDDSIVLVVKDTGCGIPKRIQNKIYDPFFTTKERSEQKGTGLGMSMVFSTINSHSGTIHLESIHEEDLTDHPTSSCNLTGTKFTISLPAKLHLLEKEKLQNILPKKVKNPSDLIFVVDDEKHFLRFVKTMIASFGYNNVEYFNHGQELVERYHQLKEQNKDLPKLIISDIQMPIMNGFELLHYLLIEQKEKIKTIIMTGKANEENLDRFKEIGIHQYLDKPFSVSQLREEIDTIFSK
ncbi:response regulator, partial [bacterium]|nr:response regulator [bacterium]